MHYIDRRSSLMSSLDLFTFAVSLLLFLAVTYASIHLSDSGVRSRLKRLITLSKDYYGKYKREPINIKTAAVPSTCDRSWWMDERISQLERRGIFSKTWIYVTHSSRFQKPGDYRTFEIAGLSILVILGKDKKLRSFHNVCRHRAYAVTKKECGSSIVLGCRYHGWSYDTTGKLIKAPEFNGVPGFDKDFNGLWEVKTEAVNGFVFVNFQAQGHASEINIPKTSGGTKLGQMMMSACTEWKIAGNFNWKLAVDLLSNDHSSSIKANSWWRLLSSSLFGWKPEIQELSLTSFIRTLSPRCKMTIRVLPQSKSRSLVEYILYERLPNRCPLSQDEISELKQNTVLEIQQLEKGQKLLLMTNYSSVKQDKIKQALQAHLNVEKNLGIELYPAAQNQSFTQVGREDDQWCKSLDKSFDDRISACKANAMGALDW